MKVCVVILLAFVNAALGSTCGAQDSCHTHFDAITRTSDGGIYAFAGSLVYKFSTHGLEPQWPKAISDVFPGLPNDIDAALYNWNHQGNIYFFKGTQYWRFRDFVMNTDYTYPAPIHGNWNGLPNDIDAAFVWGKNGKSYFVKDNVYYRYNDHANCVDNGYPSSLSAWDQALVGANISAAFQDDHGVTYFFGQDNFYQYNDEVSAVEDGYPLSTSQYWLGCSKTCSCSCSCDH